MCDISWCCVWRPRCWYCRWRFYGLPLDAAARRFSADRQSGSKEFEIPYDRQALADYLCVERSALSAEISKLIDKGVIESRKSHFKLL